MVSKKTSKKLEKAYKGIFKAIKPLRNDEAITQLEMAKLDILLNDNLIVIDGKSGSISGRKNKDISKKERN